MSKFDGLFPRAGKAGKAKNSAKTGKGLKPPAEEQQAESPKRGRPAGKRSAPDYVGFTTYIRRDTHRKAKIALLENEDGRELSELVEELIAEWLKNKPKH